MSEVFEVVIGLEVHVQLSTRTKLFSSAINKYGGDQNTHLTANTIAHPGTLPVLNKEAITSAVKLGLAMNCSISDTVTFDRKNYFYPDLPKGYQITQDANPICGKGGLWVENENEENKFISLTKIHLEEDAGKSIHKPDGSSYIDLNRAGVPLLEIVTDPVITSSVEASNFLTEIRRLVRYLDISDGNMEEGSLRCDANVSLNKQGDTFGSKVELKNMNSFRNVAKAIESEIKRQTNILDNGEIVISETRTYNPDTDTSSPMREKEVLNDYRYFPEPDVAPVELKNKWIQHLKSELPILPQDAFASLIDEFELEKKEAYLISEEKQVYEYFIKCTHNSNKYKLISNWINGEIRKHRNELGKEIDHIISSKNLCLLIDLIDKKTISNSAAQKILVYLIEHPDKTPSDGVNDLNLKQERNVYEIIPVIDKVLDSNPQKVKEYLSGKKGLTGFFMGQIMRETKGKIDPKLTNKLLVDRLNLLKK